MPIKHLLKRHGKFAPALFLQRLAELSHQFLVAQRVSDDLRRVPLRRYSWFNGM